MDIKCRCGRYARVNMGFEWVCWECRAKDLYKTHEEDWRDYTLREKQKELSLYKLSSETNEEWVLRCRAMYRSLAQNLDMSIGNDTRKQG